MVVASSATRLFSGRRTSATRRRGGYEIKYMWYVYVLKSKRNGRFYTGITNDLKRQVEEHNGKRGGEYTSNNGPFELIFYEAYLDKNDATKAELFFKSGYAREVLKDKLSNYLKK
jgi:putative endonuclease